MNVITLDFETYYSQEYSLSKLTTEEYVRDERFQIIGCSIKVNDGAPCWFAGHFNVSSAFFKIPWDNVAMLAHNNAFDGFILSHQFGIVPKMYLDTLSMARPWHHASVGGSLAKLAAHYGLGTKGTAVLDALGKRFDDFTPEELARYGEYCCNDNNLCRLIYHKLLPLTPRRELLLIDRNLRMFCDPRLMLDAEMLEKYLAEVVANKEAMLNEVALTAPQDVLMSNQKLALLLESMGVDVPMKLSPATKEMTYAFAKSDKEFVALTEDENPLVAAIVSARLGVKSTIEETRARRYLGIARRGTFPVALQYCGAWVTQRMSGGDKQNSQNLKRGGTLRKCIMAPPGYMLCSPDSSNIELRVNHTIAGQLDTVQALREGRDLYCEFASMIYGRTITKADTAERFLGKLCIAEGSLVLTNVGLVPIEEVTVDMRVWDGVEWVAHSGAVFNGEAETITYETLTATPDHLVYLQDGSSCRFETAANQARHIAVTEHDGKALWLGGNCVVENTTSSEQIYTHTRSLCELSSSKVDRHNERAARNYFRLSALQSAPADSQMVGSPHNKHETSLHEFKCAVVESLRWAWDTFLFWLSSGSWALGTETSGNSQRYAAGSHKQRRALCSRESSVGFPESKFKQQTQLHIATYPRATHQTSTRSLRRYHVTKPAFESQVNRCADCRPMETPFVQTKRRVWDILNAGPRHRFTVSGRLVSNCHLSLGYGCGPEKFREICRLQGVNIDMQEAERIVYLWRDTYDKVAKFWKRCENAIQHIAAGAVMQLDDYGLVATAFEQLNTAPSNQIQYPGLQKNEHGSWYYKVKHEYKYLYGPKMVENIAQHLARNIVMEQLLMISVRYPVVLTSHDNVGYLAPDDEADEALAFGLKVMSTSPTWWPDIPLAAEGVAATRYS